MAQSKFLGLNLSDAWKSVIMAFLAASITTVLAILQNGGWPTSADLLDTLRVSLIAAFTQILKSFFTNSEGEGLKKEP